MEGSPSTALVTPIKEMPFCMYNSDSFFVFSRIWDREISILGMDDFIFIFQMPVRLYFSIYEDFIVFSRDFMFQLWEIFA